MKTARRLPGWIPLLAAVAIMAVLFWLGAGYLARGAMRGEIPQLPDLGRRTVAVRNQVTEADAEASRRPTSGEALGGLGMVYHANNFQELAEIVYQLAGRADPEDFRWPYYTAALQIATGRNEQALAFLTRASELNPDYVHAWARLGQLYFHKGLIEDARGAFERALELDPRHEHALLGMARLAMRGEDWAEAARLMEGLLAVNPASGPAHGVLTRAYENLGRPEDAREHEGRGRDMGFQMRDPLLNALYEQSSTGSVLVTQAQIAQLMGDMPRAEKLLRRAVLVAPDDKDVRLAMARCLTAPGVVNRARIEEAKTHLEAGLGIDPEYVNTRHEYATVIDALGDAVGAEAQWQRLIREEPQHAMALMGLGQVYFRRGDYERAREFFMRGMAVPPDTPFSLGTPGLGYHRLAMAQWATGRTADAITAFQAAIEEDPRFVDAYADYARLLKQLGSTEEAKALMRQALEQEPDDAPLLLSYGNLLLQLREFEAAEHQLNAALERSPNDPRALSALGYVRLEQNDVEGAIFYLQSAIRIRPDHMLAHFHLGNAFMQRGLREQAIAEYETALRLRSDFEPARQALEQARSER